MVNYLVNCFLLLIPILIWNALLYKKLPDFYQPKVWDNIPKALDLAENILRYFSFSILILLRISFETRIQIIGLIVYLIGLFLYFLSWFIQISRKTITIREKFIFRAAPAYTTIVWFFGIGMIGKYPLINYQIFSIFYYSIVTTFVIVHTYHSFIICKKYKE